MQDTSRAAKRRRRAPERTSEELYAEWCEYLEAAFKEIVHGWWNRKVFRAVREMFTTNPQLWAAEGRHEVWTWIATMYGHYAVMLVRREVDTQPGTLNLLRLMHALEQRHDVLAAHAKGRRVPSTAEIREDRTTLERDTSKVALFGHRFLAHRTPPGAPKISHAQLDDGLRAVRRALIKYHGVINGADLGTATPEPQFDWLAPFQVSWMPADFEEPPLEEKGPMSEAEKQRRREVRQRLGFHPS